VATVGIIPRIGKDDAVSLCREIVEWLAQRGHDALVEAQPGVAGCPAAHGSDVAARADLLVVLGGDGTLLHAARLCAGREVPILGVNLGTLGFLTEVPRDGTLAALEKALNGALPVSSRSMLQVRVTSGGQLLLQDSALNDVVVSRAAQGHLVRLEVEINGSVASNYDSDGLIVATPTGSTAYSLAAGGPIVYPTLDAIVLTPICPHALTQRPVLLPGAATISVRMRATSEVYLNVDGNQGRLLEGHEEVVIRTAPHRTLILRNPEVEPFGLWRDKLRWGAR
jgi:NAD+ kinase